MGAQGRQLQAPRGLSGLLPAAMTARARHTDLIVAALAGAVLWFLGALLISRREPWYDGAYWAIVYPLSLLAPALLAYRFPERPALLALVLFEAQFLAMCLRNGELGNLWPLGMALFAVLSLPAVFAAKVVAARSPRRGRDGAPA